MEICYKAKAVLKWENIKIQNVQCSIFIDEDSLDFIKVILNLNLKNFQTITNAFKIQFKARSGKFSFLSKEAYVVHVESKTLKTGQVEYTATLEVYDLIVSKPQYYPRVKKSINKSISFIFRLNDNNKMPYFKQLMSSYDGSVKVFKQNAEEFVILNDSFKVQFDTFYNFVDKNKIRVVTANKVCVVYTRLNNFYGSTINNVIGKVDDLLTLLSLYYRQRIVWTDFQYCVNNKYFTHYRRRYKKEYVEWEKNYQGQLVSGNLYYFLNNSFPIFLNTKYKNEIAEAIQALSLNYGKNLSVEANFLNLFFSIERIVLKYRKLNNKEFIFIGRSEWEKVKKKVVQTLKQVIHDSEKGHMAIDKVGELRRYPLRRAYEEFCKKYNINLDILWELFYEKKTDKPGLNDLRNYLIHDNTHTISNILIYANYNLQYTLEIILLVLLKYSLKDSYVNSKNLLYLHPVKNINEIKKVASNILFKDK